jgi:tRNA A37 threonylcarbamoyladenosine modification protein TsaB
MVLPSRSDRIIYRIENRIGNGQGTCLRAEYSGGRYLDAARAGLPRCDTDEIICAMLDARKKEVYAALFRRVNRLLQRLSDDSVMSVTNAIEMIQSASQNDLCSVIGDGAETYEKWLLQSLGTRLRIVAEGECSTVARRVAELAQTRFGAAAGDDLGALVPVYLRLPEAEGKKAFAGLTY